jgi:hypothetical protein
MAKSRKKGNRNQPSPVRTRSRKQTSLVPGTRKKDSLVLTPSRRACIALQLDPDYEPDTHMTAILEEVGISDVWGYLRHAENEEARTLVRLRGRLAKIERDAVTIDHYIAAGKVDFHKVLGAISEQVSRIESGKAAIKIAISAPKMVEMADFYGTTPDGHADRKMILQSGGVAPVPKNQVTNVTVRDNVIDARHQVAIGQVRVPTLEEVVKDIDAVFDVKEIAGEPAANSHPANSHPANSHPANLHPANSHPAIPAEAATE